jgi:hypothetical protein
MNAFYMHHSPPVTDVPPLIQEQQAWLDAPAESSCIGPSCSRHDLMPPLKCRLYHLAMTNMTCHLRHSYWAFSPYEPNWTQLELGVYHRVVGLESTTISRPSRCVLHVTMEAVIIKHLGPRPMFQNPALLMVDVTASTLRPDSRLLAYTLLCSSCRLQPPLLTANRWWPCFVPISLRTWLSRPQHHCPGHGQLAAAAVAARVPPKDNGVTAPATILAICCQLLGSPTHSD